MYLGEGSVCLLEELPGYAVVFYRADIWFRAESRRKAGLERVGRLSTNSDIVGREAPAHACPCPSRASAAGACCKSDMYDDVERVARAPVNTSNFALFGTLRP